MNNQRLRPLRGAASSVADATTVVRSLLGTGTIRAGAGELSYSQWLLAGDEFSIGRVSSSGNDVHLSVQSPPDLLALTVLDGDLSLEGAQGRVRLHAGDHGLVPLQGDAEARWTSVRFDLYCLSPSSLLRHLPEAGSLEGVRTPYLVPRSGELGQCWQSFGRLLATQVLSIPALRERELLRTAAVDAFTAATIEAFGISGNATDEVDHAREALNTVELFMCAHLADPISVRNLARAVRMSPRALQALYERNGAGTPTEYLRRRRLERARDALLADNLATTVTSVARRFGYTNVGRFAAHYRASFDESPSAILLRARGGAQPDIVRR